MIKSLFSKKDKDKENKKEHYISVIDADKYQHSDSDKKKKIATHANNINEFISKFCRMKYPKLTLLSYYIREDILTDPIHQIYKAIEEYIELLKANIIKNKKLIKSGKKEEIDNEVNKFAEKIEEFFLIKIYKFVFPEDSLQEDINFYNKTKELSRIIPEQLDIKKLYINQLRFAISNIKN